MKRPPTLLQLTTALLALGVTWRVLRLALGFPFWGDEAFVGVNLVTRDYAGMVQPLVYGQIVPVGFMWAQLALSRLLGLSEWALRLLPTLAGIATLLLFGRFARQTLPRPAVPPAVGLLAASFYAVRHGAELKPYATDAWLSLGLTMLAWHVLDTRAASLGLRRAPRAAAHCEPRAAASEPPQPPAAAVDRYAPGPPWPWFILYAALAVWCSYPVVFVAVGVGILLTWRVLQGLSTPSRPILDPERRRLEDPNYGLSGAIASVRTATLHRRSWLLVWFAYAVLVGGSTVSMYLLIARPHAAAANAAGLSDIPMWQLAFPPWQQPLQLLGWLVWIHTGLMFAYPHGGVMFGSVATFAAFVIGCIRMYRRSRLLLALLLVPFAMNFAAALVRAYPYGGTVRTSLYLAPAICLLAGLGAWTVVGWLVNRTARVRKGPVTKASPTASACPAALCRQVLYIASAAFTVAMIGGMIGDVVRPYQSKESQRSRAAIRAIARQTRPGDRWIVFNADRPVDYAPYLGDWRGIGGQFVFDVLRYAPRPPTPAAKPNPLPAAVPPRTPASATTDPSPAQPGRARPPAPPAPWLAWAPLPESVEAIPGGCLWLLVYRASSVQKRIQFPDDLLTDYLERLKENFARHEANVAAAVVQSGAAAAAIETGAPALQTSVEELQAAGPQRVLRFEVKRDERAGKGKFESIEAYGFGTCPDPIRDP